MSILSQFKQSQNTDFPNVRPSLDLRFALAKKLDPRITFTRGSTGTYFGPDGLMRTADVNEPRFDHDPITGQSLGLLIEESRQNIALQSENINTSPWGTSTLTFATNSIVAPDGNTTADKLIENSSFSSFKTTAQSVGTISGTYTVSGFFKAGERFSGYLQLFGAGGSATAFFNLRTGTITGGAGTNTIIPYGNGWYRVSSTATFTSATAVIYIVLFNSNGVSNYTGDGTSGIYVWGAQVEVGAFPTSYIPTVASTRTRAADFASITGKNFSSFYNQSEGSILCNGRVIKLSPVYGQIFWAIGDSATFNESMYLVNESSTTTIIYNLFDNGSNQFQAGSSTITDNSFNKSAVAIKLNDSAASFNGSTPSTDTSCTLPTVNSLKIGNASWGTLNPLNGTISRLTYYPKRLTNQQLQVLTK